MVDLNNCFVKQFEADVHLAYQQMGTKLRSTVRTKSNVVGMSTTFQKSVVEVRVRRNGTV